MYPDTSLVSYMLVKFKVDCLWCEMPIFHLFLLLFPLSQIRSHNCFGSFKFILFCAITSSMSADVVIMPNWLDNPLFWEDHCMDFKCAFDGVLANESFNWKYVPSARRDLLLELENLGVGYWGSHWSRTAIETFLLCF